MNVQDYLFSVVFVGLVFLQVRGRRVSVRSVLLPLVIAGIAAGRYLRGFPAGGNDLALVMVCAGIGLGLGLAGGAVTSMRPGPDGVPVARAGPVAVVLWIAGTGSRLALGIYAGNGGGTAIAAFARSRDIDARTALPAALILMALGEVLGRYGLRAPRSPRGKRRWPPSGTGWAGSCAMSSPTRSERCRSS